MADGRPPARGLIPLNASGDPAEPAFYARLLTQVTVPHCRPKERSIIRNNGNLTVAMEASAIGPGLPYGTVPRLLMVWMTTEAVRTKRRELVMGARLADFMRALEITPTGGKKGGITALHDQMLRLFTTAVSVLTEEPGHTDGCPCDVLSRSQPFSHAHRSCAVTEARHLRP